MPTDSGEKAYGTAIEHQLTTAGGYEKGAPETPGRTALVSAAVTGKIDVRKEVSA